MRIYGLSGLGADKRVFKYLHLNAELISIEWVEPLENESISEYAKRIAFDIDQESEFGLIGVSFGGIIAIELRKILNPKIVILISSIESHNELRLLYRIIGKFNFLSVLPNKIFKLPNKLAHLLFGARNKELLDAILNDTSNSFTKWAIIQTTKWENESQIDSLFRIHGDKDRILPIKKNNIHFLIPKGQHFMVVDRADEISLIINRLLN